MKGHQNKVEKDFNEVRKQFYDLASQGDEAISLMLELARESEHPRAFEVLGQLIKQNAEICEKILKLHESKKKVDKDDIRALAQTEGITHNNVFIGSTAELQKMLRDETVIEPDTNFENE